jgi:hypothetical protein
VSRPAAPLLRAATATSPAVYEVARWDLYLQQTAEWIAGSHAFLEQLGRSINLPRYWVTAKVPLLRSGPLTLYPVHLTNWFISNPIGIATPARLVNIWRTAPELSRGEGGVSVGGGFRPALNVSWRVDGSAEMGINSIFYDPFHARGWRGGSYGEVTRRWIPNAPQLADMVEQLLRFVEATPPEAMIKYAGDEFSRLTLELLGGEAGASAANDVRGKIVGAASATAGVLALIPGAQAYAAIVGALAAVLAIIPFAKAERTWCGSLLPTPGVLHYSLCHLGSRLEKVPDPFYNPPPEGCALVQVAPQLSLNVDLLNREKKAASSSVGMYLLGGALVLALGYGTFRLVRG